MKEPRNPFRLRRSESIDTDVAFLSMFEPGILEVISEERWNQGVHTFRSAAGGGKTSLLRLFTPNVLLTLHSRRTDEHLRELHQRLSELGAISSAGPCVLGILLLCGRNYAMLQDLDLDQARKDRLFFGLLNARIILATLRSALALRQLEWPDGLSRIRIDAYSDLPASLGLRLPCDGVELFSWAEKFETRICESLDSFGPLQPDQLPGHESLYSLSLIGPSSLFIDGTPVAGQVVLMMDDIHKLSAHQRGLLVETVIEIRSAIGVWIAERFEALSTEEMLASGAIEGRDQEKPVALEWYWRRFFARFERHVLRIGERRVLASPETDLGTFRSCLQDTLEDPKWEPVFARACDEIAIRVRRRAGTAGQFRDWIAAREQLTGTARELALAWRALEVLIERELRKAQRGLFDQTTQLDQGELEQRDDSSVQQAAELFLCREYGLPYYFGPDRIARLASLNIQQFLGLAGDIFEEVTAAALLGRPSGLPPERQHDLMKAAARAMWEEIPRRVHHGRELRKFLESVGRFSEWYTYRPTAPNDPGVGGTAIRMSERAWLMADSSRTRPDLRQLANVLASALAHNLLIADLDYRCKGESWMVLNLNRLLCVHFDLPLGYGLYKERPIAVLGEWLDRPFEPPNGTLL